MDDKHFSVDHEPALSGGSFETDPAERRAGPVDQQPGELEQLRDSVTAEPALPQYADASEWNRWLAARRQQCTPLGDMAVTLAVALLSGPFAILGAMLSGRQGAVGLLYVVVFAPVVEELLKQSGMTYLLEQKPYRVFATWQFLFAGAAAGLSFGAIENLVYIYVYAPGTVRDIENFAAFRWAVCVPVHVVCAMVASLGLARAWKRQSRQGGPVELTAAFGWFIAAMVLHGSYNLAATFIKF